MIRVFMFILITAIITGCDSINPGYHYEIILKEVPGYKGKDAWKNRIKLYINNEDSSFVQPFDYYELSLSVNEIKIEKDSLFSQISFMLPERRGLYDVKIKANLQDSLLSGSYKYKNMIMCKCVYITSRKNVKII